MGNEIIAAIIGAIGVIVAAWITVKYRGSKNDKDKEGTDDVVNGDKIVGDVISGNKIESHGHINVAATKPEKKSSFVYGLEVLLTFLFTCALAGGAFGVAGFAIGQEVGAVIGGTVGFIAGVVNAGSVKRIKGIM